MQTRFINVDSAKAQAPRGYSHMVEVTGPARLVFLSGQLGFDREGKFPPDFRGQAVQAFKNLKNALETVGGDFGHVVKFTVYVCGDFDFEVVRELNFKYLPADKLAASTFVVISGLARPQGLIEIEAIAALPPQ